MSDHFTGLSGKIGGLAVKGMIRETEECMAKGEQISAAPASPGEAARLQRVKAANKQSSQDGRWENMPVSTCRSPVSIPENIPAQHQNSQPGRESIMNPPPMYDIPITSPPGSCKITAL